MTEGDVTKFGYWFDLAVKGAIACIISLVGMDYRAVKKSLTELESSKYHLELEVQVLKTELSYIKKALEKIDDKLDKVLSR